MVISPVLEKEASLSETGRATERRIRLARFRTPPSQGGNTGSNPVCATTLSSPELLAPYFLFGTGIFCVRFFKATKSWVDFISAWNCQLSSRGRMPADWNESKAS